MSLPLVSALQALLAPGSRHRNDQSSYTEHDVARHDERLPAGLSLRWLGTAGFELSYAGTHLLIDPYLTRPTLRQVVTAAPLRPSPECVAAHLSQVDAILIGHTHFDHALDVPLIAREYDAPVYGSSSLVHLMGLHGEAERAVMVQPRQIYEIGPFQVTFIESVHAKLLGGLAVPAEGELSCDHLDALHGRAYRCGQVYGIHIAVAGVSFYHQGSANLLDDQIMHRGVDYFLAGIAGRGFTPHYMARVLAALQPRVVIPHHFDDFFRPLGTPMGFSLNVNFGGFIEEVHRVSRDFRVRTLQPLQPWRGDGSWK